MNKNIAPVIYIPLKGVMHENIVKGIGFADPYRNGLWI